MARTIDTSKPLSDEDRNYLLARGKEQLVHRIDAEHGDEEAARKARYIPGTSVDQAEGVLDTPNQDDLEVNGGGDSDPDADEGLDNDAPDYDSWKKDQLVDEIKRRNAQYADEFQMSTSGTKEELAARLREDDATSEDEDDESES